jgi:uncharacterized damage-inducible protein DinB
MKRLPLSLVLLALVPVGPLVAQEHMHDEQAMHEHMQSHDAAVGSVAPLYEMVKGYLIAAAEQMPEEHYGYRPTPEVRTFGEIVGHVANAAFMFCGAATGEGGQPSENYEERTSKAGLVEAIKLGFGQCDAAYAMDDAKAMEEVEFFGQTGTRLLVLTFNTAHNWEHYGNLVTYMRANGQVPPSSQRGN